MRSLMFQSCIFLLFSSPLVVAYSFLIWLLTPDRCQFQLSRDKMLAGAATSDERVVMKRRAREAAEQAYERDIEMRVKVLFLFFWSFDNSRN
jgi:hypothetical protein